MKKKIPKDFIGKKVVYKGGSGENGDSYEELGVIVNAWYDPQMETIDCYVALYESGVNFGKQGYRPSILHYFLESLEIVDR